MLIDAPSTKRSGIVAIGLIQSVLWCCILSGTDPDPEGDDEDYPEGAEPADDDEDPK